MERLEGYFTTFDEKELYYQSWQRSDAKLDIIVCHGLAEHSEPYHRLAQGVLDKIPVNLLAFDLRGHGKSAGKRGLVKSFDDYLKDLVCFVEFVRKQDSSPKPFVLLGHSMGGLISVKAMIDFAKEIPAKALILSSPLMGIEMSVSGFKEKAAKWMVKYLPTMTMDNQIDFADLTHDNLIVEEYKKDPLRHSRICPRLYLDFLETFPYVMKNANVIQVPLLMQIAGEDRLVSKKSSLKFYDQVGSLEKNKFEYSNLYHEIYNEEGREKVYLDLIGFLEKYFD